eukprot:TRINITY_DN2077_c0_g2_i1.p1 TRINITY_DN2077_c0_g2~~TRINITY_DN2077_c0_g2_i1.p1  ORF type:complete len:708 (+),score=178.73 TRINITY_DN2077_c0_g2_i1:184-2124(+)
MGGGGMGGSLPPPPMPEAPAAPPPPSGGGSFPSMAEIGRNSAAHCSGKTINDQEVKVQDDRGSIVRDPPRYATFDQAPFPSIIQDALKKAGFPAPSQIQQYCWPLAMKNTDVIGVAATGSGKTISFLLPAFAYIMERQLSSGPPSLVVMAPTRELAIQIQEESDKFGKPMFKTVCCYGGAPKHGQAADLRAGVHGVIGTPGRINDFLEGEQLRLDKCCKLVLDEADRMLDMGFEPQIRKILAKIPSNRHTMFFTATWPASVRRLASEFLSRAYTVTIGNRDELKGNQDITQTLETCRGSEKNSKVLQILKQSGVADRSNPSAKGLVFCSTKRMCDQLAQQLERNGVPCAAVHGDKKQNEREMALNGLKDGKIKLLVATDVAARGLDIKGVTLVINYDPPSNTEDYVHRIGRTGRAGQKGHAVALICERDTHALRGIIQVMKRTNQAITPEFEELARNAPAPPPSGRASRGGPPPVQIDSNFKSGLSTGGIQAVEAKPGDAAVTPAMGLGITHDRHEGRGGGGDRSFGSSFGGRDRGGGDGERPGDWTCPGCGANIFASKDVCFKCGHSRASGGGGGGGDRGRDRRRSPSRRRRSPSRKRRRSPSRKRSRSRSERRRRSPSRDKRKKSSSRDRRRKKKRSSSSSESS